MKSYLITTTPTDKLWEYPEITAKLFEDYASQDLAIPSLKSSAFYLPNEINLMIIASLFETYLQTRNFDLAFQLLKLNKFYTRTLYFLIFGFCIDDTLDLILRVGNVMGFLTTLHDEYVTEWNHDRHERVVVNAIVKGSFAGPDRHTEVWNLDPDIAIVDFTFDTPHHIFQIGPYFGDVVWTRGEFKSNGLFDCRRLHRPVFIFNFVDLTECMIFTEDAPLPNSFTQFSKLLTRIYGPDTHCLRMMKYRKDKHNPFIVQTDLITKF
jgi:hypothetical protein